LLRVQKLDNAAKIWAEICTIHEGKTELVQIDMRQRLHDMRCEEGGDTKTHLSKMLWICESLAGMGATIDDKDFYAIILGSLPESYRPLLSSINATARINKKILTPDELINLITEEYEHRLLTDSKAEKRGGSALSAKESASGKPVSLYRIYISL
jgi:hypothetical protein